MLVVAPLRVCRQVWRQEAAKWTQFSGLTFTLLHGAKKDAALRAPPTDIYLINPEGMEWLCKQYPGRSLPFDVVTIDELTKFQNSQAIRSKVTRPRLKNVRYRWGLTGSLFAKGAMSVFGQQLILDDGAALGKFFTHFRDNFFTVGFDGFSYDLLPGGERRIAETIAPYWFYMDPSEYSQLPPIVDVPHVAVMDKPQQKLYDRMKNDMLVSLPQGMITASNAGACYSKLAQMANGAAYLDVPAAGKTFATIHDLKLDMLEELIEELNGEPLLVAYEFNHDLERLKERFAHLFPDGVVPYLGNGTTAREETQWVADWNARRLPVLFAHPASAGHGLNMQEGQAYNVAHLSIIWDWESYDQFIRRVRRSGNEQARIFNHLLIVKGTLDEMKLAAVQEKDFTERRLVTALNAEIIREANATGEENMVAVRKLSQPGEAAPATPAAGKPTGWGAQSSQQHDSTDAPGNAKPTGWGQKGSPEEAAQRARIQEQIAPTKDRSAETEAAFSGQVADATKTIESTDYNEVPFEGGKAEAKPRSRAKADNANAPVPSIEVHAGLSDEQLATQLDAAVEVALIAARSRVIAGVMVSSPDLEMADIVEAARDAMDFVTKG